MKNNKPLLLRLSIIPLALLLVSGCVGDWTLEEILSYIPTAQDPEFGRGGFFWFLGFLFFLSLALWEFLQWASLCGARIRRAISLRIIASRVSPSRLQKLRRMIKHSDLSDRARQKCIQILLSAIKHNSVDVRREALIVMREAKFKHSYWGPDISLLKTYGRSPEGILDILITATTDHSETVRTEGKRTFASVLADVGMIELEAYVVKHKQQTHLVELLVDVVKDTDCRFSERHVAATLLGYLRDTCANTQGYFSERWVKEMDKERAQQLIDDKLVRIYVSSDPGSAKLLKSLLERAGMPSLLWPLPVEADCACKGFDSVRGTAKIFARLGPLGDSWELWVWEWDRQRAQQLIDNKLVRIYVSSDSQVAHLYEDSLKRSGIPVILEDLGDTFEICVTKIDKEKAQQLVHKKIVNELASGLFENRKIADPETRLNLERQLKERLPDSTRGQRGEIISQIILSALEEGRDPILSLLLRKTR